MMITLNTKTTSFILSIRFVDYYDLTQFHPSENGIYNLLFYGRDNGTIKSNSNMLDKFFRSPRP